jgi:hypothetical protein
MQTTSLNGIHVRYSRALQKMPMVWQGMVGRFGAAVAFNSYSIRQCEENKQPGRHMNALSRKSKNVSRACRASGADCFFANPKSQIQIPQSTPPTSRPCHSKPVDLSGALRSGNPKSQIKNQKSLPPFNDVTI